MLTRELAISRIHQRNIQPDRLTKSTNAEYVTLASQMLAIYESGIGRSRQFLHVSVERLFSSLSHAPPRRIGAFCKLLDERSEYAVDSRGAAAKLRMQVFQLASQYQPLVSEQNLLEGTLESEAKSKIAKQLNRPWSDIERSLFSDLPENHLLTSFRSYETPTQLLARYNVAQSQAVLYDAQELVVTSRSDLKSILRYAKLARLMHRIRRVGDDYRINFDGPASLLQRTTRYGVAMAKFLPGLLSCHEWSAVAIIQKPKWGRLWWHIDSSCGLHSETVPSSEFDSKVEQEFYRSWEVANPGGWTLHRECELLHHGQIVFFPDFEARHPDGRRVHIEIVGYWTPEYLEHKNKVLKQFADHRILLLVQSSVRHQLSTNAQHAVIEYKTKIKLEPVVNWLNTISNP